MKHGWQHLPRLRVPLQPRALLACVVTVKRHHGAAARYDELFPSTSDAVIDAMDRYPDLRSVSAKPKGKQR